MADFLFELGLEEVPARMLATGEAELARRVRDLLARERLLQADAAVESFSTPRRLAVLVHGVLLQQADSEEDLLGPPLKAAYKDGVPTAAAQAFAKKAGVDLRGLRTITNAKGEYLSATVRHAGRSTVQLIAEHLPSELAAIYWPKSMYWRPGKPERFVRPVQWMVSLLDNVVVPIEWAGITAGRMSYGHRVLHGAAPVPVDSPAAYRETLRQAKVIVDVEERRQRIRKALDHITRQVEGARWREDHPLVDKATHLTEWPSVLMGGFEKDFLQLPEEVLITVMRDHQNYFAPQDAEGNLLPYFLAVLNTEVAEQATHIIRHGNERVLRARFNDARFFYEFDQRIPLLARVPLLENVTFQKDLGSYAKKTERVLRLAQRFAELIQPSVKVNLSALTMAARLSKTDLTTELVKEFTELQGVIGGLYAAAQGHGGAVATAIYDQYLPVSVEGDLPRTMEGLLLSLADKADTIACMFSLGLHPTGSKDPFALRRAANGIVRILAEGTIPLTLEQVASSTSLSTSSLLGPSFESIPFSQTQREVNGFLFERLDWYLREAQGSSYDVVKAVLATNHTDVPDAIARAQALGKVRDTEDFAAVSAAFKRMKNIIAQAEAKGEVINASLETPAGSQPEQTVLQVEAARVADEADQLGAVSNYDGALAVIATLRPAIDAFFDRVMVMAPEPDLRAARLGMLQRILHAFSKIADFSEIVIAGS